MNLVTAGTSRIGREIVKRLDNVLVHYHTNRALAEELSPTVIQADLSTIDGFLNQLGKFDIIVNNFAFVEDGNYDIAAWEKNFRANVILPAMLVDHLNDKGVMINISSIMALPGIGSSPTYCGTKAALNKLTDTFHKPGIRINAVAPAELDISISAELIADEVIRIINDTSMNNKVVYLWGTAPEEQKRYAL